MKKNISQIIHNLKTTIKVYVNLTISVISFVLCSVVTSLITIPTKSRHRFVVFEVRVSTWARCHYKSDFFVRF